MFDFASSEGIIFRLMKFLSILFFFFTLLFHSQIQDWKGILYGNFKTLKKENIKSLMFRKNGEVIRKMEIGQNTITVYNNDKLSEEFHFNNDGTLLKYNHVPQISVEFLENNKIKNYSYDDEVLKYEFDENSKELLFERRIPAKGNRILVEARYFVKNQLNNNLSYQDFFSKNERLRYYEDHETRVTFRSLTDYTGAEINDRQTAKDSIISGKKEEQYHFNKKNELINKRIIKDSIYETGFENNKIEYYIVKYKGNAYLQEYYRNGILRVKVKNKYYPTENGTLILWKVSHYDAASKKTYVEYPNKKEYKLRNNILVERYRIENGVIYSCGGMRNDYHKIQKSFLIETFSHSILFDEKLQKSFNDNFDASSVSALNEIFNATLIFSENPLLLNTSGEQDADNELVRTTKEFYTRKEKWNTYFNNSQVEVITNSNKKYISKLTGQFQNFSFPINIIFIQN